jgi:hypothetical protein
MWPVSWCRSQSFGCSAHRAACKAAGSRSVSAPMMGPAMPGTSRFARVLSRSPSCASQPGSIGSARRSGHSTAGRIGIPSESQSTTPCIWPERPSVTTSASGRCARTSATALEALSSHRRASVSEEPVSGSSLACGQRPTASSLPSASTTAALDEPVPMSIPRATSITRPTGSRVDPVRRRGRRRPVSHRPSSEISRSRGCRPAPDRQSRARTPRT